MIEIVERGERLSQLTAGPTMTRPRQLRFNAFNITRNIGNEGLTI
jgi:hypothetical protein